MPPRIAGRSAVTASSSCLCDAPTREEILLLEQIVNGYLARGCVGRLEVQRELALDPFFAVLHGDIEEATRSITSGAASTESSHEEVDLHLNGDPRKPHEIDVVPAPPSQSPRGL